MKYSLETHAIYELGQRLNQEDSTFPTIENITQGNRLFVLCDGMGGHEKGEVASSIVCATLGRTILKHWNCQDTFTEEMLSRALDEAYDELDKADKGEEKKMGTTLTLLCLHAQGATIAHIGDSRVYQIRPAFGDSSAQILFQTQDHSLVNDLVKVGEITSEEAKTHPQKNVITRAMQPHQVRRAKADIYHTSNIKQGDYFFMCSDGMLEQTSDANLLNVITKESITNIEKVEILKRLTEENKDNHTAFLIQVKELFCESEIIKEQPIVKAEIEPIIVEQRKSKCVFNEMCNNKALLKVIFFALFFAIITFFIAFLLRKIG